MRMSEAPRKCPRIYHPRPKADMINSKDGGLSTAATVADGGPDDQKSDPTYKPS